jgi:hypothetical protein
VYFRTATIMETLRRVYGDEAMAAAFGRYARKNRFQHPGPDAFLACIEEGMGASAAANLRAALFEKGWVDYAVLSIGTQSAREAAGVFDRDGKRETVRESEGGGAHQGWVVITRRGTLTFPVDVELTLEDGSTQRLHWSGDTDGVRLPYVGTSPLRAVEIDPEERILVDQTRTNNFASAPRASRAGAPRTSERLLYWAELALQQLVP